jgi:hypothetical protein
MAPYCGPSLLLLLLLLLPFASAGSVHMYSHSSGWSLTPSSHSAAVVDHSPISIIAFLQFHRVHIVVRRADAAPDAESFRISAAACAGSGGDHAECFGPQSVYELAPKLSSAASDLDDLLLAVAGSASPYGCSHVNPLISTYPPSEQPHTFMLTQAQVVNPSILATSSIPDGSGGKVTLITLRASVLTGQQLQRATFALARVASRDSSWRLLSQDFVAVAPDPLRLPVNVLPIQVSFCTSCSIFVCPTYSYCPLNPYLPSSSV